MFKNFSKQLTYLFRYLIIVVILFEIFSLLLFGVLKSFNVVFNHNFKSTKSSEELLPHPIFNKLSDNFLFDPNTVIFPSKDRYGNKFKLIEKKDNKSKNIVFLGGSTVEGDGVETAGDTIPGIFDKILINRCDQKYNVYNYGISGFTSKQEFITLSTKIVPYNDIDYIISLNGVNDFGGNLGSRKHKSKNLYFQFFDSREIRLYNWVNKNFSEKIVTFLINRTFTGNLIFDLIKNYIDEEIPYKLNGESFQNLKSYNSISLKKLSYYSNASFILSEKNEIKYFHFLQPVLFYKNNPTKDESNTLNGVKDTYGYGKRPNFIFNKNFWSAFKSFYTDVRPNLKNFEFSYDISKLFENSSDKDFVDHVHYSKIGNKKIAITIFDKLEKDMMCTKN